MNNIVVIERLDTEQYEVVIKNLETLQDTHILPPERGIAKVMYDLKLCFGFHPVRGKMYKVEQRITEIGKEET